MLRDYQKRAIDDLHDYLEKYDGNPCLVLPTGSGKSHIVAEICRHSVQTWPETRILMLTHVKELIEQNAGKMLDAWPRAPLGIYSAGLKQRNFDSITVAGIQSVRDRADEMIRMRKVECGILKVKQLLVSGLWQLVAGCWFP